MRLGFLSKGQQLRLMVFKASTQRSASSAAQMLRTRRAAHIRPQARGGALFRELEAQQEERAAAVTESKTPVVKDLHWDRPLRIIKYPDPRLRAVNARIGIFDSKVEQLGKELLEVMYNGDDGVGLAAPQVGVNVRLMVYNPTGRRGDEEFILVNPKILNASGRRETAEEGCLSFPKIFADVERDGRGGCLPFPKMFADVEVRADSEMLYVGLKNGQRPQKVKIRAQDVKGETVMLTLTGWQARIFQHEYDHLQGTLFHDRMKAEVVRKVKRDLVSLEEAYLKEHPGADIQRV